MKLTDVVTVTQTELYVLAIHALEARIDSYNEKLTDQNREYIDAITAPLNAKLELIKSMYEIETGSKYC